MKYFFDESGSFIVTEPSLHIMTGIAYPDIFEKRLNLFYDEFIKTLKTEEFDENGEAKGRLLSLESRERLFSFLKENHWLRISISLTDSEYNTENEIKKYRKEQIELLNIQKLDPIFQSQSEELKILQNKLISDINTNDGLNDVLVIKGLLLMHTLLTLFIDSLQHFTAEVFDDSWEDMLVCFDRQDKNNITPLEDWINREFLNIITVYIPNPIELSQDWFERNHPLINKSRNKGENSLDLKKIFNNNFLFASSEKYFQLQIVDWISNTLFRVFKGKLQKIFFDLVYHNLIKYNTVKINVVRFETTDSKKLFYKYREFLL